MSLRPPAYRACSGEASEDDDDAAELLRLPLLLLLLPLLLVSRLFPPLRVVTSLGATGAAATNRGEERRLDSDDSIDSPDEEREWEAPPTRRCGD
jgi:hypothetical protein